MRDGEYSGSGIYLTPGFVITAAHVTPGWTGSAEVYIDGAGFPASRVKQGVFEDVDLALFSVDPINVENLLRSGNDKITGEIM